MELYPQCPKWRLSMAPGYERVWHVKDYPDISNAADPAQRGSVSGYCWGDYQITDGGMLMYADCIIHTGSPLLLAGHYSLFVMPRLRAWYLRAAGSVSELSRFCAVNYWLGSAPPYGHDSSSVYPTLIPPSKVRRLIAPLEKCDGPARLAAEYVLADLGTWDDGLIWSLENKRGEASARFFGSG